MFLLLQMLFSVLRVSGLSNVPNTGYCPVGWLQHPAYTNKCYLAFGSNSESFNSAITKCDNTVSGATLAIVFNKEVHTFITQMVLPINNAGRYYIGLMDDGAGSYQHIDNNEPLSSWNAWLTGTAPSSTGCALYEYHSGTANWIWNIVGSCNANRQFVCEYTIPHFNSATTHIALLQTEGFGGRLEVWHYLRWGTVSHQFLPYTLADTVCGMLALQSVKISRVAANKQGTGQVWLSDVDCSLGEADIGQCVTNEGHIWGAGYLHDQDVWIQCTNFTSSSTTSLSTINPTPTTDVLELTSDTSTESVTTTLSSSETELTTMYSIMSTVTACTASTEYVTLYSTVVESSMFCQNSGVLSYPASVIDLTPTGTLEYTTIPVYQTVGTTSPFSTDYVGNSTASSNTSGSLTADRPSTARYKAKTSAKYSTATRHDHRPSAVAIGSFGIVVLVCVGAAILISDLVSIDRHLQYFKNEGNQILKPRRKSTFTLTSNKQMKKKNNECQRPRTSSEISINNLVQNSYVETENQKL